MTEKTDWIEELDIELLINETCSAYRIDKTDLVRIHPYDIGKLAEAIKARIIARIVEGGDND